MHKIRKKTQRAIRRRGRNIARPKKGEAVPAGFAALQQTQLKRPGESSG